MNKLKKTITNILNGILPVQIKNSLFHLSFHLAHTEFKKFAYEYSFAPDMELGLEAMAKLGFSPKTIVDIGAFEGNWSKLARKIWPESSLYMVEPNQEKKKHLLMIAENLNAQLICELLGAENGQQVTFHLMESGSSIMEERSDVPRTTETRHLCTLDSILHDLAAPGLLKIDAQGYELEIIKGASKILTAFEAVLLEVSIIEINKGAPLLHDVIPFMDARGFVAYDILEIHRRPLDKAMNQIDIIFINKKSTLIANKRHF